MNEINYTELIRERGKQVLAWRERLASLKARRQALWDQWETENKELLDEVAIVDAATTDAEDRLRELALAGHRVTGEKKFPGVEIKEFTVLEYNPIEAMEWAKENAPIYIYPPRLADKGFEAYAKTADLEFVVKRVDPRAQIATKLAEALGGE